MTQVRKLDWQETYADRGDGGKDHTGWEAENGFGEYYTVEMYFGSDSYGWQVNFDYTMLGDFDDPERGKACAQADFERRILACLSQDERSAT